MGREVVVAVARWVEERGPHRDARDWSNAKAMCTRPKNPRVTTRSLRVSAGRALAAREAKGGRGKETNKQRKHRGARRDTASTSEQWTRAGGGRASGRARKKGEGHDTIRRHAAFCARVCRLQDVVAKPHLPERAASRAGTVK